MLLARENYRGATITAAAVLAANLLLPAHHVIVTFSVPIRSLAYEIQRFSEPPAELDPRYHYLTGSARLRQNDFVGARSHFDQALQLEPRHANALFGRAQVFLAIGDSTSALRDVEKVLRVAPKKWPSRKHAQEILVQLQARLLENGAFRSDQALLVDWDWRAAMTP